MRINIYPNLKSGAVKNQNNTPNTEVNTQRLSNRSVGMEDLINVLRI